MNIQLTPQSEIEILRKNIADMQEQLQTAYRRIDQLLIEKSYSNSSERLEIITKQKVDTRRFLCYTDYLYYAYVDTLKYTEQYSEKEYSNG